MCECGHLVKFPRPLFESKRPTLEISQKGLISIPSIIAPHSWRWHQTRGTRQFASSHIAFEQRMVAVDYYEQPHTPLYKMSSAPYGKDAHEGAVPTFCSVYSQFLLHHSSSFNPQTTLPQTTPSSAKICVTWEYCLAISDRDLEKLKRVASTRKLMKPGQQSGTRIT